MIPKDEEGRNKLIRQMAQYYGEDYEELKKKIDERPEILEGWLEAMETNFKDCGSKYNKHYRSTYYE